MFRFLVCAESAAPTPALLRKKVRRVTFMPRLIVDVNANSGQPTQSLRGAAFQAAMPAFERHVFESAQKPRRLDSRRCRLEACSTLVARPPLYSPWLVLI